MSTKSFDSVRRLVVGLGNPGSKYAKTRHNVGMMVLTHFQNNYAAPVSGTSADLTSESRLYADIASFNLQFGNSYLGHANGKLKKMDLVDCQSERRANKTKNDGVPYPNVNVDLMHPLTFMNLSGNAVRAYMNAKKFRLKNNSTVINKHDEILVVHDDISLPFGSCAFKPKGGDGGQNGVKSIIKCVGTDKFARLRVGIADPSLFQNGKLEKTDHLSKYVLKNFNPNEQDQLPVLLEYCTQLLRVYLHRGFYEAASLSNGTSLDDFLAKHPQF